MHYAGLIGSLKSINIFAASAGGTDFRKLLLHTIQNNGWNPDNFFHLSNWDKAIKI